MFVLEARASLALRDPTARQAEMGEMGEMVSKETPDLQVLTGRPLPYLRDSDYFQEPSVFGALEGA